MAEEKKIKISTVDELPDDLDELSDDELDAVAGGILANPQLSQNIIKAALSGRASLKGNLGPGARAICDCWSYTAGQMLPGKDVLKR